MADRKVARRCRLIIRHDWFYITYVSRAARPVRVVSEMSKKRCPFAFPIQWAVLLIPQKAACLEQKVGRPVVVNKLVLAQKRASANESPSVNNN